MDKIDYGSGAALKRLAYFALSITFVIVLLMAWEPMNLGSVYIPTALYALIGALLVTYWVCGSLGWVNPLSCA